MADSTGQFVVVASSPSYSVPNIPSHQAFLVVGNVPHPPNHFQTSLSESGYTAGSLSSGNATKTVSKSNFLAEQLTGENTGNTSSVWKKTKSEGSRKRHRVDHSELQCSECSEVSSSLTDLAQHLATTHSNSIRSFKCLYCAQIFLSQTSAVYHIKSVLLAKKPSPVHVAGMIACVKHTCPVCAHVYVSAQHLKVHLLKSQCGEAGTRQSSEVPVKNTKLACMKAVLQSYKPTKISVQESAGEANAPRERGASGLDTLTNLPSSQINNPQPRDQHISAKSRVSCHGDARVPPPPHFYPPLTYIRAPLVMSLPPTQYYNLDCYQYPSNNMTHNAPNQFSYQPRVGFPGDVPRAGCPGDAPRAGCPGDAPRTGCAGDAPRADCPGDAPLLNKQLFSCLHCGSKFAEFDLLTRHFRDNTCNSAAHSSLQGIVNSNTAY